MALKEIRAALVTILKAVPKIGPVYDFERDVREWAKIVKELTNENDSKIEWWTIRREKRLEPLGAGPSYETQHGIVIRGFRALDDAGSSKLFDDERIEPICAALRSKTTLNGTAQQIDTPWQVDPIEDRVVAGVLVHYCEIRNTIFEPVGAFAET